MTLFHPSRFLKNWFTNLYGSAAALNEKNIRRALSQGARQRDTLVDLGCGDGVALARVTEGLEYKHIFGIERDGEAAEAARRFLSDVIVASVDATIPLPDSFADAIVSNQVIEHLNDTDTFMEEVFRILRPGGELVLSSENLASWHNIFALFLGFQAFSCTNYSRVRCPIGNPLSIHIETPFPGDGMTHRRVFTTRALRELVEAHGFEILGVFGAGYHPFPAALGNFDTAHAYFMMIHARKPRLATEQS
uniref:Methyltransferase type 11 domain-containing protein n=1 Tax=mine drainage metagenome TaxID=410659 RepID=E6Q529_9ZZZZ